MGEGAVTGAQPRVAGDGGAEFALPAGGFEGEAFIEGGVECGAVDGVNVSECVAAGGGAGAAVDPLEDERADVGLELAGAPAQVTTELAAELAGEIGGARWQRQGWGGECLPAAPRRAGRGAA